MKSGDFVEQWWDVIMLNFGLEMQEEEEACQLFN